MLEPMPRDLSERLAGAGRTVYAAGVLALTEPGPAAAGLVVQDERGRTLLRRASYLGQSTRLEAAARALLTALRLAATAGLEAPLVRVDEPALLAATREAGASSMNESLLAELREAQAHVRGLQLDADGPAANPARGVALEPLLEWLPERTRRADELRVQRLGERTYLVESASQPGQRYTVTLPGEHDGVAQCECADFQYRGIPCKHLLAAAREAGALQRLFYPDAASQSGRPGRGEAGR